MSKYTKLSCVFIKADELDYEGLGLEEITPETEIDDIYVDLHCISHFYGTDDHNVNIFINGVKCTIKAHIKEFEKLMNSK